MGENSKIEWTTHTFNPWIGCTQVSPGCVNCYAETQDKFRKWTPDGWGKGKPRRRTEPGNWNKVRKWNHDALEDVDDALHDWSDDPVKLPPRPRVFCASLADWLDEEVPTEWLADLLVLIHETPALDWLLLSKRPENWHPRMEQAILHLSDKREDKTAQEVKDWLMAWVTEKKPPHNVWIGTTVEDQLRHHRRMPVFMKIPAVVRFLSCEPLLGPVKLWPECFRLKEGKALWVICGGESGPDARPMHPEWARSLRDQCQVAGVPFLFKQWGEWAPQFDADGQPLTYVIRGKEHTFPDMPEGEEDPFSAVIKVGKAAAGRLLDGRTWDEFPKPEVVA